MPPEEDRVRSVVVKSGPIEVAANSNGSVDVRIGQQRSALTEDEANDLRFCIEAATEARGLF